MNIVSHQLEFIGKAAQSLCALLILFTVFLADAQQSGSEAADLENRQLMEGDWLINEELSDNSDDQVEEAIKEGGGKVARRFFRKRPEDFYRGGPEEQELYDRITYDDVLSIEYAEPEFTFTYADDYQRIFHTDGRRRRTTANNFYAQGGEDFSFGNWEAASLVVEARPRDGGFTLETYTLEEGGNRLRVEMTIEPESFRGAIRLTRVYDRAN
ncbi:MAG: hypothetical protein COB20_14825 [SAR86 cluster bacterium]|uniref:Uncharacterized protein n=1 Tax=SAR86 cluster bacterium TaxID=2030880 RepID=A0A2A4WWT6_9GAMM|nr:MAG: hypothetical protein COB20_14825 [SAR86 cluster bacterium]